MRLGISLRFRLALALLGMLAAGFTGYYGYFASRTELVDVAEQQLLTATQVLGRRINLSVESTARNVRMLSGVPAAAALLSGGNSAADNAAAARELQSLFVQMLGSYPEYFQIRLISAADFGLERVRVDRDSGGSHIVTEQDMQEKGHYPYVFNTLTLARNAVYLSRVVINHETGIHAGEGKPVLQIAAPIYGRDKSDQDSSGREIGGSDKALGLIVINVDLNSMFALLAEDLPGQYLLYLANSDGDFLIHPDRSKAFAFEQGRESRVQQQFAATSALVENTERQRVTITGKGDDVMVSAFVRLQSLPQAEQDSAFILGLAQPLKHVLAKSDKLGLRILQIVLLFSIISIILASVLSHAITRPLDQMVQAVRSFTTANEQGPLPTHRRDEIGVLARSFADMQKQIYDQLQTLHEKQRELDHRASHDSLTGLPNRRLLEERLEHALARSRRNGEHIALLYIDVDSFKEINDKYGHGVGDLVLKEVAHRIRAVVREIDTVARLGGDEFIVLLDGNLQPDVIAQIAQKVLDALIPPIVHAGHALQVGASIGISQSPQHGTTGSDLTATADHAMYVAKNSGRNQFRFALAPRSLL